MDEFFIINKGKNKAWEDTESFCKDSSQCF